jgi:hypothetical protein
VVDGPARLLRRLTGDCDDLDDLLGAEGGRGSRPRGVGQHLLDQVQEYGRSDWLLFGLC